MNTYIYKLIDPRTSEVRYIGKTVDKKRRFTYHRYTTDGTHRSNWIAQLRACNLLPIMEIIEEVEGNGWVEREKHWISHHKELGCRLTNATDGGEGETGFKMSEETKQKLRNVNLGTKHPERGVLISEGQKKSIKHKEGRKKTGIALKDKYKSLEYKEKFRLAAMKRWNKTMEI